MCAEKSQHKLCESGVAAVAYSGAPAFSVAALSECFPLPVDRWGLGFGFAQSSL